MKEFKLICFDLDETLIRERHSVMIPCIINGKSIEHDMIQKREEANEIDYKIADYLRAELLTGLKESKIMKEFLEIAKPIKNIKETITRLQKQGMKCILITVGPVQVAKVVSDLYGFDGYYGSTYEVVEGVFTGRINQYVSSEEKIDCLIDYCNKENVEPFECISVGDGATDIPLFKYCGKSIAINSTEKVKREATHWIDTDDLWDIFSLI